MTRREIYNFIALQLKDPNQKRFTDAVITTVFVSIYKSAIRKLGYVHGRYYSKRDTITITAGNDYVDLPADYSNGVIFSVHVVSNKTQLTNDYDIEAYTDLQTGTPTCYVVQGSRLYFDAKPSANTDLYVMYSYIPALPALDDGGEGADTEVTFPEPEILAWKTVETFMIMYRIDPAVIQTKIIMLEEEMKNQLTRRDFGTHSGTVDAFNAAFGDGEDG